MSDPEPDRSILENAVRKRYPDDEAQAILADPKALTEHQRTLGPIWDAVMGCWLYHHNGMLLGVERDGYGPHS